MNTKSLPPMSTQESYNAGCTLFVLGWLLVSFLCGFLIFVGNIELGGVGTILALAYPFLFIAGCFIAVFLGYMVGYRLWPQFYQRLENRPLLIVLYPSAGAGLLFAILWFGFMVVRYANVLGIFLIPAFLFVLPGLVIFSPMLGAVSGLVAGKIATRYTHDITTIRRVGGIGGGLVSLMIGVLLYLLFAWSVW